METCHLPQDIIIFGNQVKTFPAGVQEAFGNLMKTLPDGDKRAYYGLSKMDENNNVLYWAAAAETFDGESKKHNGHQFILPKGVYLYETIKDWRSNIHCIKDVFFKMLQDEQADLTKYCIEWYKTDEEMVCMLQVNPAKKLLASIDAASEELRGLLSPLSEKQINTIPFEDSWTAAQLADHVTKSNRGIEQAMNMEGTVTNRDPAKRAGELADVFLNFSKKMKSPEFILPKQQLYEKTTVLEKLKKSNEGLKEKAGSVEADSIISHPNFGQITKLEMLYFVLYHTQRHTHQLKNIIKHI